MPHILASYYDCSNWVSIVEVTNTGGSAGSYAITLYDRDGSAVWTDNRRQFNVFATYRIQLNTNAQGHEGAVIVNIGTGREGGGMQGCVAMLIIRDEGRDWHEANRFVPFVPETAR